MVNLRAKPYYLNDEDIEWVRKTIEEMTDEEKVGQLFFQLTAGNSEEYLAKVYGEGWRYPDPKFKHESIETIIPDVYAYGQFWE